MGTSVALVLQVVVEADEAEEPTAVLRPTRYTLPPEVGSAETHEFSAVEETDTHPVHNPS